MLGTRLKSWLKSLLGEQGGTEAWPTRPPLSAQVSPKIYLDGVSGETTSCRGWGVGGGRQSPRRVAGLASGSSPNYSVARELLDLGCPGTQHEVEVTAV